MYTHTIYRFWLALSAYVRNIRPNRKAKKTQTQKNKRSIVHKNVKNLTSVISKQADRKSQRNFNANLLKNEIYKYTFVK